MVKCGPVSESLRGTSNKTRIETEQGFPCSFIHEKSLRGTSNKTRAEFSPIEPKVACRNLSDTEYEGLSVADTAFQFAMSSGDDELTVEFS